MTRPAIVHPHSSRIHDLAYGCCAVLTGCCAHWLLCSLEPMLTGCCAYWSLVFTGPCAHWPLCSLLMRSSLRVAQGSSAMTAMTIPSTAG